MARLSFTICIASLLLIGWMSHVSLARKNPEVGGQGKSVQNTRHVKNHHYPRGQHEYDDNDDDNDDDDGDIGTSGRGGGAQVKSARSQAAKSYGVGNKNFDFNHIVNTADIKLDVFGKGNQINQAQYQAANSYDSGNTDIKVNQMVKVLDIDINGKYGGEYGHEHRPGKWNPESFTPKTCAQLQPMKYFDPKKFVGTWTTYARNTSPRPATRRCSVANLVQARDGSVTVNATSILGNTPEFQLFSISKTKSAGVFTMPSAQPSNLTVVYADKDYKVAVVAICESNTSTNYSQIYYVILVRDTCLKDSNLLSTFVQRAKSWYGVANFVLANTDCTNYCTEKPFVPKTCEDLRPMHNFDLDKFVGTWATYARNTGPRPATRRNVVANLAQARDGSVTVNATSIINNTPVVDLFNVSTTRLAGVFTKSIPEPSNIVVVFADEDYKVAVVATCQSNTSTIYSQFDYAILVRDACLNDLNLLVRAYNGAQKLLGATNIVIANTDCTNYCTEKPFTPQTCEDLKPMDNFDLDKFVGTWATYARNTDPRPATRRNVVANLAQARDGSVTVNVTSIVNNTPVVDLFNVSTTRLAGVFGTYRYVDSSAERVPVNLVVVYADEDYKVAVVATCQSNTGTIYSQFDYAILVRDACLKDLNLLARAADRAQNLLGATNFVLANTDCPGRN